jgi:putative sterol carrier protein
MIQFYTKEFFDELARRLSADVGWRERVRGMDLRIVCTAVDKKRSFLLQVKGGMVTAAEAVPESKADYHFEGRYEAWVKLCKGEAEIDALVQTGKIRIAGPLQEAMGLMGPLNHMVLVARSFPKEF